MCATKSKQTTLGLHARTHKLKSLCAQVLEKKRVKKMGVADVNRLPPATTTPTCVVSESSRGRRTTSGAGSNKIKLSRALMVRLSQALKEKQDDEVEAEATQLAPQQLATRVGHQQLVRAAKKIKADDKRDEPRESASSSLRAEFGQVEAVESKQQQQQQQVTRTDAGEFMRTRAIFCTHSRSTFSLFVVVVVVVVVDVS